MNGRRSTCIRQKLNDRGNKQCVIKALVVGDSVKGVESEVREEGDVLPYISGIVMCTVKFRPKTIKN